MHRLAPLSLSLLVVAACAAPGPPADLVIENVTVIDLATGESVAEQSIFVEAGRIILVAPSARIRAPEGADIVDAAGRYAIPGLWDAHVHSATSAAWHFPLLVAHGVTAVRNMHTTVPDALGLVDSIRTVVASGAFGPRFLANGPIVDGPPAIWPGAITVSSPAQASSVVDSLADGGADFIKVYDNLRPDALRAVLERAGQRGIPVDGHLPLTITVGEVAASGWRSLEHAGLVVDCSTEAEAIRTRYREILHAPPLPFPENMMAFFSLLRRAVETADPALCRAAADALADGGVAVTPTLVNGISMAYPDRMVADEEGMRLLPAQVREEWAALAASPMEQGRAEMMRPIVDTGPDEVRTLHEAGVVLLAGTDIGNAFLVPGRTLHDELAFFVQAGLTPLEALRTATVNPARVLASADTLGAIAAGYVADVVLLEADPLADIDNVRRISSVVLAGVHHERAELDALVADAIGPDGRGPDGG